MFSWEIEEFTYRQRQTARNCGTKPYRGGTNHSQLRFCNALGVQVVKNAFSWNIQWRLIFMHTIYLRFFVGQNSEIWTLFATCANVRRKIPWLRF